MNAIGDFSDCIYLVWNPVCFDSRIGFDLVAVMANKKNNVDVIFLKADVCLERCKKKRRKKHRRTSENAFANIVSEKFVSFGVEREREMHIWFGVTD